MHYVEFNNFLVMLYSCPLKFRKVMRQQTWGDGGRFNTTFLSSRSENTTVKELLKSVYSCKSYCKNKSDTFFWDTV